MRELIQKLIDLKTLHIPNTAELMWPEQSKQVAGAKLRNKINKVNNNRLTEKDWELMERVFR